MPLLAFDHKECATIPSEPGVYLFLNEKHKILYVGKAVNLRSRVRSYFNKGSEEEVRTATIRAVGIARVLTVDKRNFMGGIHEDPSLALRLVKTMSHRIRDLTDRLAHYEEDI